MWYDSYPEFQPWEPDEWDTINANEADDYRHELDEALDGETCPTCGGTGEEVTGEDGYGEAIYADCATCKGRGVVPPGDTCEVCHEPADCCECDQERIIQSLMNHIQGFGPWTSDPLACARSIDQTYHVQDGHSIDITLENKRLFRLSVREMRP